MRKKGGGGEQKVRDIHEIELEGTTKDEKLTSNLGTPRGGIQKGVRGYGLDQKLCHLGR